MKIVNISLTAPYNENWGYQENLLTKWQKNIGNNVTLITTRFISNKDSIKLSIVAEENYINNYGIKIIRQDWLINIWPIRILRVYKHLYKTLENEHPDFIFIHGCQFLDALQVCKYLKKHNNVKAVCDNHADETNSAKTVLAKLLHYTCWKFTANRLNRYVSKFYGVLPIRCDFLTKYYNIPSDRVEFLQMGLDDDSYNESLNSQNKIKSKYSISTNYTNIVCGGKFDHFKKDILNLMKTVNSLDNYHLYIYGSIADEIKDDFNKLLSNKITYTGWLNQIDSYALINCCDIACFPGRHSVIWEQVVGIGIPLIVKKLPGTDHINIGGNCIYLSECSEKEIRDVLLELLDKNKLNELKKNANSDKKNMFKYSQIAKKSIEYSNL